MAFSTAAVISRPFLLLLLVSAVTSFDIDIHAAAATKTVRRNSRARGVQQRSSSSFLRGLQQGDFIIDMEQLEKDAVVVGDDDFTDDGTDDNNGGGGGKNNNDNNKNNRNDKNNAQRQQPIPDDIYHCRDPAVVDDEFDKDKTVICDWETHRWDVASFKADKPPKHCEDFVFTSLTELDDLQEPCYLWQLMYGSLQPTFSPSVERKWSSSVTHYFVQLYLWILCRNNHLLYLLEPRTHTRSYLFVSLA